MSYTTAYALWIGERFEEIEDLRNSHGSATVVWGKLFARYVDGSSNYPESGYMWRTGELWPLYKRMDIPKSHRAVLAMTYDNAYVSRDNFQRAAADIRAFLRDFTFDPAYVNHWPRIVEIFESQKDAPAIGFRWTSVCENPFQGPYNEDREDYDPPEWEKYWEMYETLDALDGVAA